MPETEIPAGAHITGFDYLVPLDDETCRDQIAQTQSLRIPEALFRRKLTVIANGPSAREIDLKSISGPTLALNGSIRLFEEQKTIPTYWAGCDPQEQVADFLSDSPPLGTVYFVASKCHPKVFERLSHRVIRVWNLMDHPAEGRCRVALAASVTISASWLMHRLGFTDFEYWGWDGCFVDGRHHGAGEADWSHIPTVSINYGGAVKDGEVVGGRTFTTTRSWAGEAHSAEQFFQLADYFDIGIKINGDGMFECARRFLMDKAA